MKSANAIEHVGITEWSHEALAAFGTYRIEQHVAAFAEELSEVQKVHLRAAWKLAKARENRQAARRAAPAPAAKQHRCPECGGLNGQHPDLACAFA